MHNLISRQDAIDEMEEYWRSLNLRRKRIPLAAEAVYMDLKGVVTTLPSAEPEPLTDKEQRIFLAAMGREEEVCKQVDDECRDCREPYEDSLVRTCHEIVRKIKGALWT